ncbi:hypothetical protein LCGC14_0249280 [marine sediment metagenome]|uniref:Uncharacterized protein n=1 Tax=marine sediment metagenome TaxID=412755 RepID=A0A0F9U563_9ZZZZ
MAKNGDSKYLEAFGDDKESLALFLLSMRKFDQHFCECMFDGSDFTIVLEVRGSKGKLVHVRPKSDAFFRPEGIEELEEDSDAKRRKPSKGI